MKQAMLRPFDSIRRKHYGSKLFACIAMLICICMVGITMVSFGILKNMFFRGYQQSDETYLNCLVQMSDPNTICGPRVMISEPDQAWEMKNSVGEYANLFINEGPCAFEEDGRHYVLYSANGGWDADYCMGLLELVGDDPMNARCWKKHDGPVLASNSVVLGPGHGSVLAGEHKVFFAGWDCEDPSPDWNSVKVWVAEYRFEDGEMRIF